MIQADHLQTTWFQSVKKSLFAYAFRLEWREPVAEKTHSCPYCGGWSVIPVYAEDLHPRSIFTRTCAECGNTLYFSSDLIIDEMKGE